MKESKEYQSTPEAKARLDDVVRESFKLFAPPPVVIEQFGDVMPQNDHGPHAVGHVCPTCGRP